MHLQLNKPKPFTTSTHVLPTTGFTLCLLYKQMYMSVEKITYLFIKSDYKLIKINLNDVLYLSGLKDYTQIYLRGKASPLTTLQNLKEFESKLPQNDFVRVHRSYIVAMIQIDYISRNEIIIGTTHIPIGNSFRPALDEVIEKHS